MKKIMFNDKYDLTDAVLKGRKTMTRRIIRNLLNFDPRQDWIEWGIDEKGKANIAIFHNETYKYSIYPQYQPGEVVAVAQRYSELSWDKRFYDNLCSMCERLPQYELKGWDNKMFVRPDLMPHQIQITNIKVELLHDISVGDCYKEGIVYAKWRQWPKPDSREYIDHDVYTLGIYKEGILDPWAPDNPDAWIAKDPQTAFHVLIRKMMGVKKWESNPFVFAYTFELVK